MKNTFRENIRRFSVVRSLRMRLFLIIFLVGMIPCGLLHYGIFHSGNTPGLLVQGDNEKIHHC